MVSVFSCVDKNIFQKSFKSLALTALVSLSIGMAFAPTPSSAQTVGKGCDPKIMGAMQKKGWMEAQREIMIAQATIAKPDSVFALGCFQTFYNGYTGSISFFNNKNYAATTVLNNVNSFVGAAFSGQKLGGGHFTSGAQNTNINTCSAMMDLWKVARCSNIDLPSKLMDTLQDIGSYNRGLFPQACTNLPPYGNAGSPVTPVGTFYGNKVAKFVLGDAGSGAAFDDMNLFTDVTAPLSLTSGKNCAAGIPTGVTMKIGGNDVPEIICPNPGCVSDGASTPKCKAY